VKDPHKDSLARWVDALKKRPPLMQPKPSCFASLKPGQMQRDENLLNLKIMTHVILSNGFDERHIAFPTLERFQDYLKRVRQIEPDRRWAILESWDR